VTAKYSADPLTRRRFIGVAGSAGAGVVLAGCGVKSSSTASGGAAGRTIKLGYVTPQTGPLAPFGEADSFVINALRPQLRSGVRLGAKRFPLDVVVKDSQSDPRRAADVASELILKDKVDLMLVASTPDTVNPVADQCEANGIPCLSSVAPWDSFVFGRKGTPDKPFKWTYHFFWGLHDIIAVYERMWRDVSGDRTVAVLWPNDSDGHAWSDSPAGGAALRKSGWKLVDPGHYENGIQSFSQILGRFKGADAPILVGVPLPPDFTVFWRQAAQQGFKPKIATIAKALLFPSSVQALGPLAQNLSSEVWWSPSHPYSSSLTKQDSKALGAAYTAKTGKPWTQPIGMVHALFEVATDALRRAGGPDRHAVAEALGSTKLDTVVGPLDWTSGPSPNVAVTPVVGGQWRRQGSRYDLTIVSNDGHPEIPRSGSVEVLT
jgi:branched-chain amino acid transport system substrate-binding protein